MVVAVDAGFVADVAHRAHDIAGATADVRTGQQRAVEQRPDAVMLDHRSPAHLADEAATEQALERAAGVIGTQREEERRVHIVLAQQLDEIRHALARPTQRIDVDFEAELHSTSARASATCDRYASKMWRNASGIADIVDPAGRDAVGVVDDAKP
jgi:hypothetical protein